MTVSVKGSAGQAQYGVLKVYVPKAECTKSSKITVSESGDGSP